jgi:hypothetical protein
MGKNVTIYLDDPTLKWLDALCKEWHLTRGKALQLVLRQSRQMAGFLGSFIKTQYPELSRGLRKMVRETEEE